MLGMSNGQITKHSLEWHIAHVYHRAANPMNKKKETQYTLLFVQLDKKIIPKMGIAQPAFHAKNFK